MTRLVDLREPLEKRRTYGFWHDLEEFVSGDVLTDFSPDTGAAVANVDAAGGTVTVTTGATDNNEAALVSTKELFLFANDKPLLFEARVKWTEANTDDANVFVGLMDAIGANAMVDDGAGPKASFSGAGFYKVDGGTNLKVIASIGATNTIVDLSAANALNKKVASCGDGAYQVLRIESKPFSSTQHVLDFYIDGEHVYHMIHTYTSATEMMAGVYVKAGGANSEVVTVDYIACYQLR